MTKRKRMEEDKITKTVREVAKQVFGEPEYARPDWDKGPLMVPEDAFKNTEVAAAEARLRLAAIILECLLIFFMLLSCLFLAYKNGKLDLRLQQLQEEGR